MTQPSSDLFGDFQRWIVRSGARSVSRELGGQIRTVFGRGGGSSDDVWASATTTPTDEAPECAWCPVCRAARRMRESGPGLSSGVAAAGDALTVVVQDAMSVLESAIAAGRQATAQTTADQRAPGKAAGGTAREAGTAAKEPDSRRSTGEATSDPGPAAEPGPAHPPEGPPNEPDHRG